MSELKALIIDDNSHDRALALREIRKLFSQLQYQEIIDETSFAEALKIDNFNLVITDYQLGWTTGLSILDRVKKQRPDCPIIMFTGTGSEEVAVEAMKAGLDDYVIKSPKHYVRLAAAVRSTWQKYEQKKALREFKQSYYRFFERIPLGLYRLDADGAIVEANSTLSQILDCDRPQDLQGKNIFEYHQQPEAYLLWQQQLSQIEPEAEFEGQVRTSEGELIWVNHHGIAIKDKGGNVVGYEGAIADITANKRAELERAELLNRERQAREEAETVNRIKDEFLATLSHELRTPLNAIIGWVQLLRAGKMGQAQTTKAIDVIDRNAKAQNQLIDDLLDVSRIIRGTMKLKLEPIDLNPVLMAALDTIRPGANAKNLEIVTSLESDLAKINGDGERLQQVFWNILINAIKFTPAGGKITISSTATENIVAVKITDSGGGIAPDVLPFVFDRFRQAEVKSSTRTKGGLGLGLAIVRHLVEMHGGNAIANSPGLGKGATFTIEFPIVHSANTSDSSNDSNNNFPSSLTGLTLLVVEDEADAREMLTLILEQCGAKVISANSVKQALILYEQYQPDILISDIFMPDRDGYDLIRQIRQGQNAKSNLPAIALTACAREEDEKQALESGFNLHLAKPLEPLQLIESLNKLVRQLTINN